MWFKPQTDQPEIIARSFPTSISLPPGVLKYQRFTGWFLKWSVRITPTNVKLHISISKTVAQLSTRPPTSFHHLGLSSPSLRAHLRVREICPSLRYHQMLQLCKSSYRFTYWDILEYSNWCSLTIGFPELALRWTEHLLLSAIESNSNRAIQLIGHLFNWGLFGALSVQVCELHVDVWGGLQAELQIL